MKDKWLKDIHDRMAGYETDEPDRLWESIQARMPQGASGAARKHAPLLRPWTKCAAAAAAVVLAFIGGISLYIRNDGGRAPQRPAPALCLQAGTTGIAPRPLVPATPPAASPATPVRKNGTRPKAQAGEGYGTGQRMDEKEAPRPERMPADGCATPPSRRKQPADREKQQRTPPPAKRLHAQATPGKKKSGRVSLSAFTAGGLSASLHGKSMGTATLNATGPAQATWRDSPTLGILLFNQGEDTERHISHKLPVRTGISMAYRLNTRLEIGTGLTYTSELVRQLLPATSEWIVRELSVLAEHIGRNVLISVVVGLWSGRHMFVAMEYGLQKIWNLRTQRNWFSSNLVSMYLILVTGLVFTVLLTFTGVMSIVQNVIANFNLPSFMGFSIDQAMLWNWVVSWIMIPLGASTLFLMMYRLLPSEPLPVAYLLPGAIFSGLAWKLSGLAYVTYGEKFGQVSAFYGSIWYLVGLMTWLYIVAVVFLLGAEVVHAYAYQQKLQTHFFRIRNAECGVS